MTGHPSSMVPNSVDIIASDEVAVSHVVMVVAESAEIRDSCSCVSSSEETLWDPFIS